MVGRGERSLVSVSLCNVLRLVAGFALIVRAAFVTGIFLFLLSLSLSFSFSFSRALPVVFSFALATIFGPICLCLVVAVGLALLAVFRLTLSIAFFRLA